MAMAQNQQTPQSLATQVPPGAKAAIMNALNASNAPTADDKKGGFHEESVKWGTDAQGNVVVSPSVQGPSPADLKFAGMSSGPINLVVGAADKKVYFYNGSGVIGKPMKLKDFMGNP